MSEVTRRDPSTIGTVTWPAWGAYILIGTLIRPSQTISIRDYAGAGGPWGAHACRSNDEW
jgi:hypothetical protein